jgi:2-isopropylmalate synthase
MVSIYSGFPVQPNKAIVGKNAFSHEAGIHQDGILKSRETYEIMKAEDVGQTTEAIRLGRHSGRHGLFNRLNKLGIMVPDADRDEVYDRFVALADRKKEIFDKDLYHLTNSPGKESDTKHYALEHLEVTVKTNSQPEAFVRVKHLQKDVIREAYGTGDGPVDALYRAIDHAVNESHDLIDYSIRSASEGADALGEVSVLVSYGGPCFSGKARKTDVLQASAEAYINALNNLASHRADEDSVKFVSKGIMQAFGR